MRNLNIEDRLNELPEKMRDAVFLNLDLLKRVDFSKDGAEAYLEYLSKRIVFFGFHEQDEKVYVTAWAENMDCLNFFEENLDGIFSEAKAMLLSKDLYLTYVRIFDEAVQDQVNSAVCVLSDYANWLRSDNVARLAEQIIEEGLSIDSVLKRKSSYAQSNLLTKSGFNDSLTVVQKRLLNFLIYKSQFYKQNDLFGGYTFTVSARELMQLGFGSNQTVIKKNLKDLLKSTTMYIQYGDQWAMYNVFSSISGQANKGSVTVRFSPEMSALVDRVGVSRNYTLLSISSVNKIKKYASMRMYELCCQYRNSDSSMVYIDDEVLRTMLNCREKYLDPHNFKRHVLNAAAKELKSLVDAGELDLYFTFREVEKISEAWEFGRKRVTKWGVVIHKGELFENGRFAHAPKEVRRKEFQDTLDSILKRCGLSDSQIESYCNRARSLPDDKMTALTYDLQLEVMFSDSKLDLSSVEKIFEKYGFVLRGDSLLFAEKQLSLRTEF